MRAITYTQDGQYATITQVYMDDDGTQTGREVSEFSYYPSGEVDTITITYYDADYEEVGEMTIKHYLDGTQPIIE